MLDYSRETPTGFFLHNKIYCKKADTNMLQSTPPLCYWTGERVAWMALNEQFNKTDLFFSLHRQWIT